MTALDAEASILIERKINLAEISKNKMQCQLFFISVDWSVCRVFGLWNCPLPKANKSNDTENGILFMLTQ